MYHQQQSKYTLNKKIDLLNIFDIGLLNIVVYLFMYEFISNSVKQANYSVKIKSFQILLPGSTFCITSIGGSSSLHEKSGTQVSAIPSYR